MDPYTARARMLAKTRQRVEERGWTFIFTPMPNEPVNFGYSIGFTRTFGYPEAMVMGLSFEATAAVLGGLAEKLVAGERPEQHAHLHVGLNLPVVLRPVRREMASGLCLFADEYYGRTDFAVVQAVWPDARGRFPWEAGHVRQGSYQPLLFDVAAPN